MSKNEHNTQSTTEPGTATRAVIEALSEMRIGDLAKLVSELEAEWGVSRHDNQVVPVPDIKARVATPKRVDVWLDGYTGSKVQALRALRKQDPELNIAQFRGMLENLPVALREDVSAEEGEAFVESLAESGLTLRVAAREG